MSALTRHIAERVFGCSVFPLSRMGYGEAPFPKLIENVIGQWNFHISPDKVIVNFDPEASWEFAGMVLDKMRDVHGLKVQIESERGRYFAGFTDFGSALQRGSDWIVSAPTGPAAITLAAARATGFREEK